MSARQPVIQTNVGPMNIDVPRTAGYYGGIGLAMAFGLIEWPLALFIAAIPVVKLLQGANAPRSVRFAVHVFSGAAQPLGGDAEGTIRLNRTPRPMRRAANVVARPATDGRSTSRRSAPARSRSTRRRRTPTASAAPRRRAAARTTSEPSSPASST